MLFELEANQYHLVRPLINSNYISVQLESVINGNNQGMIYVDSIESPKTAIVYHQGEGGFYFIGDSTNIDFVNNLASFMEMIKNEFKKLGIREFEFSGDSELWNEFFKVYFVKYDLYESSQNIYIGNKFTPTPIEVKDYMVVSINEELFSNTSIKGKAYVQEEILHWWHSISDYLKFNKGYVAIRNNEIVARCLLDGAFDDKYGIGIAVKEKHRKKGIAYLLSSKMCTDIINDGNIPYWECTDDNYGSIALTKKCGLKFAFNYKIFGFTMEA